MWPLLLFGVRRTSSLDAESHSMPYSSLIWVALSALVLLSVSWPLFKLRYMSNTERFSPRDGWYLILAFFLMSTAAAVIVLNASYLSQVRDAGNTAMEDLAKKIKKNFQDEVRSAFEQLRQMRTYSPFTDSRRNAEKPTLYGAYLSAANTRLTYPYFEIAFWTNCTGDQLLKLDVRDAPTPPTNVSSFTFFKTLNSDAEWTSPNPKLQGRSCLSIPAELDQIDHAYLEPVISPNTDEFSPVLAAPFAGDTEPEDSERIAVQVLALRPMSVVDPVLPPGYAFAVINRDCEVLFHSDSFRDLKENFCEESKNKTELRPWLVSGVNTPLSVSYAGRTQQGYLTSFPLPQVRSEGDAFLLVFGDGERQLTLNLAVILVCSLLLGVYFLVLVGAAILHLSLREPLRWAYAPQFIWPSRQNSTVYLQVFCANFLLFAFYWVFYRRRYEAPLLVLTVEVALVSLFFGLASFYWAPRFLLRCGASLIAIALAGILVIGFFDLFLGRAVQEWLVLFLVLAAGGLSAVLISGRLSWTSYLKDWLRTFWLFESVQKRFTLFYALAAVSAISCIAVVPCLGFFKYAYDAVSEISLKHSQVVLSERLLARRDRIRGYYEELHAPEIAPRRLQETWDRYDTDFYASSCDPALGQDSGDCEEAPAKVRETERVAPAFTGQTWNDWIERQVARATLTFPSNDIGSEMSRLGVASTEEAGAWERSWLEINPRYFLLRWKPSSRLPSFTVASSYAPWNGLTGWATASLVLVLTGLVFWLMRLTGQVFLTKVESAPGFETVDWKCASDIARNSLVIGRAQSGKSKRLKGLCGLPPGAWRDLRSEVLRTTKDQKSPDQPRTAELLILDHFEFNIRDHACNLARLDLIENLLYEAHCRLVIVSTVDPLYFFTEEASKVLADVKNPEETRRLLDRWARVLSQFTKVNLLSEAKDELLQKITQVAERGPHYAQFAAWTLEECGGMALLRNVGVRILDEFQVPPPATREQLTEIVLDRAGAYYHVLWSGLTAAERLVLYQLALDGWANPKNTPAIQQLDRKRLIYRAPMFRIINNSFRKFIQSTEHAVEIAQWEKHEQQSMWRALRFVIIAAIIGVGVWLLYAQSQLFQLGAGNITAIATLLTALAGFSARLKPQVSRTSDASIQP